jgi:hypothetical protein
VKPAGGKLLADEARWDFVELSLLVAERGQGFPDALDEWHAYLKSLDPYTGEGGYLPPQLEKLVESVFAPLLAPTSSAL